MSRRNHVGDRATNRRWTTLLGGFASRGRRQRIRCVRPPGELHVDLAAAASPSPPIPNLSSCLALTSISSPIPRRLTMDCFRIQTRPHSSWAHGASTGHSHWTSGFRYSPPRPNYLGTHTDPVRAALPAAGLPVLPARPVLLPGQAANVLRHARTRLPAVGSAGQRRNDRPGAGFLPRAKSRPRHPDARGRRMHRGLTRAGTGRSQPRRCHSRSRTPAK